MKTSFISTHAISAANRLSTLKTQERLVEAQKEVSTGRLADVGASLGYKAGGTISLRQENLRLNTIIDTNAIVSTRLDITQSSLQNIAESAQNFINALIGARTSDSGAQLLQKEARTSLGALSDMLNVSVDGAYIFAGTNADILPMPDYFAEPTAAARQSVANAFLAEFGFSQDDPTSNAISATGMQTFLDGAFDGLFDESAWSSNWSSSGQPVQSRISTYERIETSVGTNEQALRQLAGAYTMIADLGIENLNDNAFQTVVDAAIKAAGSAIQGVVAIQSEVGIAEERIANANDRMSIQADIMINHINILEGVDPYEASTRVSSLLTQLETSYALTARIQRLSLTNFI